MRSILLYLRLNLLQEHCWNKIGCMCWSGQVIVVGCRDKAGHYVPYSASLLLVLVVEVKAAEM